MATILFLERSAMGLENEHTAKSLQMFIQRFLTFAVDII